MVIGSVSKLVMTQLPHEMQFDEVPSGGASGYNNTGRFVIEGTVKNKDIIKKTIAAPLDGNPGGGIREYQINPNNIKIKNVSGVNPEF